MKARSIFLFLFLIVLLPFHAFAGKQLVVSTDHWEVNVMHTTLINKGQASAEGACLWFVDK